MSTQNANPPHIGAIIGKILREKNIRKTEFARIMGMTPTSAAAVIKQPSLRMYRLWEISVAMKYDVFAELSNLLPEGMEQNEGNRNLQKIAALEQQVKDLQKEIEIYEKIMGKK